MGKRSSQRAITIDTHALLWYLDMGQNKKLSMLALQAIADAEHDGIIYVPAKERTDTIILQLTRQP